MVHEDTEHETLLTRLETGDSSAIRELLTTHMGHLEAYVRMKLGPGKYKQQELQDIVQSVCGDILTDEDRFEFRGLAEFRYWLCKQALHKIVSKHRHKTAEKRDQRREEPIQTPSRLEGYASMLTPSRIARGKEELDRVEAAMDQLPEQYREAVLLYVVVGLDYPAIASAMDRTVAATRQLVYRGRARLTTLLDETAD